jgi:succinate dehydrogenase / fumarate reductase cytochrome b subunit
MARLQTLAQSSVGKKILMAVTGLVLVAFVIAHMVGNLKVYLGREHFNAYARFLRTVGTPALPESGLLWILRVGLLLCVGVHLWASVVLTRMSWAARSGKYAKGNDLVFSYASRTMRWGGVVLLAFVVYHLLHLTTGTVHPDFVPEDAYHNFVAGFRSVPVSVAYLLAMGALAFHLYHGLWSATQTLGIDSPRVERFRRPVALAVALVVFLGNASFPVAVLAGVVR